MARQTVDQKQRTTPADQPAGKEFTHQVAPLETPFGVMMLVQRGDSLCEIRLKEEWHDGETLSDSPLLRKAAKQLTEYFAGERTTFDLPLAFDGTVFQRQVWQTMLDTVPYGATISYGELANRCGHPKAARAVGNANHVNPLPIVIPCHRVVGSGGKLVGYGGGLTLKASLLKLEAKRGSHT